MSERERERGSESRDTPTTMAIAVEDERIADEVLRHIPAEERNQVRLYDDPRDLIQSDKAIDADVTLVSYHVMKNLARHHLDALTEFSRRHPTILLVRSNEFLDSVGFLEMADGVLFLDATMHRMHDIMTLAGAGYSILPSNAAMDIVTDRLRSDTIKRLSPLELSILDQVRLAKTNRAIARTLGLTEANVKTKVRAILKALKFQNRTEAAVFAARQQQTIKQVMAERAQQPAPGGPGEGEPGSGMAPH